MVEQISGSRSDAHWLQPRPSSTETQYCIYNRVIYGFGDGDARVCPSNTEYMVQSLRKAYVTETHHGSTFITQSKDRKESVGSKPTGPPDVSPTRNQVKEQSKYITCQKCIWKERQAISGKGWTTGKKRCPSTRQKSP